MGRKKYKLGLKYLLSLFTEIQEVQEKSSFRKPASMHKYLIRHLFLYILYYCVKDYFLRFIVIQLVWRCVERRLLPIL